MSHPIGPRRGLLGLAVLSILIAIVALPALAAEPSASPTVTAEPTPEPTAAPTASPEPTATAAPTPEPTAAPAATAAPRAAEESGKPTKPPKAPKADKAPGTPVSITGTVSSRTDADGRAEYTINTGGRTLVLDGGPSWFYGDDHPLGAHVGKRVTITGTQRAGELEVDVEAVNGQALRAAGKPPWAGGWKQVGERHPGWTQEKMDRWQARAADKARALGTDCFPPGQCKDKPNKGGAASDDMTGADAGG